MSDKSYYFNEFSKDDVLYSLAQKAKDMLEYKDYVLKIYHNYKPKFYGLSLTNYSYCTDFNDKSVVSSSQQRFLNSLKHGRVSKSPETACQVPSTPVKRNQNISTLQRKHLLFDNVGNEVSQSVTKSPEQSTSVKIFRSAMEPESSPQRHTTFISADKGVLQIVSKDIRKQLTPDKVNENATELEKVSSTVLPLNHKAINKVELANLESYTPVRQQTVIVSHKKIDREILNKITEVGKIYVNPTPQDHETVSNPEAYMIQTEKFDEPFKVPFIVTSKVKEPLSSFKGIGVDCVPTTDGSKNTRPKEKATTSENQKSFSPTGENTEIIQIIKVRKKNFSPVKKVKISNSPTMSQNSVCSDDKDSMLVHSYQDIKKNLTPKKGSNLFKNCERKKKSPSPRTDTVQCSSKPKIMQASGAVEIETDISESKHNPSPKNSPISFIGYKIQETITDNIDKEKSPKDITFSGNKSKPGTSKNVSPSSIGSIANSPPVVTNTSSQNQGSDLFKNCERKRKPTSPRRDAVQCSPKPKIIQSSGTVDIETDISFESKHNPSPKNSPISFIGYKIEETITDNIDKEKSPKDITFSGNKSKPGTSKDVSPSTISSITSSPPFLANTNSGIKDVINVGKDRLSCKSSKISPLKNSSPVNLSSPRTQNMDSQMLVFCITELETLLSMREECLNYIFKRFSQFRKDLEYLCYYLQITINIVLEISFINAEYVSEKLELDILHLVSVASKLVKKVGSWKTDTAVETQYWSVFFKEIRKIISRNEPLVANDKPLVTIEVLHRYENDIKTIWGYLDALIKIADSRRSKFVDTEHDVQMSINMFLECLVTVGILKPAVSPQ